MIRHNIFKEDTIKAIDEAAEEFRSYPYFDRFFRWWSSLIISRKNTMAAQDAMSLAIQHAQMLGLKGDMLPLVCMDWILPCICKMFHEMGIPKTVMIDSLGDIEIWTQVYRRYHNGETGMNQNEWVFRSLTGQVLRFGSLQFEPVTYEFPFVVFQNKEDGSFRALAASGLTIDQDGYLAGTNLRHTMAETKTRLQVQDSTVCGYEVNLQKGIVECGYMTSLNSNQWEIILAPGEQAVAVHIPESTDLSPEKTDLSFQAAREYYKNRLHGSRLMFVCDSWLLDCRLEELLPLESKICRFMKRFYKLPVFTTTPQILERVMGFDFDMDRLTDFSCQTSLQERLKRYLLEGNEVFTTGGFITFH